MTTETVTRSTRETDITVSLSMDRAEESKINSGVPLFDHFLEAAAFSGGFSLSLAAEGDLERDDHHTLEDTGIVIGTAVRRIADTLHPVCRYSWAVIPMDEALVRTAVDIGGRSFLKYDLALSRRTLGGISTENIKEFFFGFCRESGSALHITRLSGENNHHIAEAAFKSFGIVLSRALSPAGGRTAASTKEMSTGGGT